MRCNNDNDNDNDNNNDNDNDSDNDNNNDLLTAFLQSSSKFLNLLNETKIYLTIIP